MLKNQILVASPGQRERRVNLFQRKKKTKEGKSIFEDKRLGAGACPDIGGSGVTYPLGENRTGVSRAYNEVQPK